MTLEYPCPATWLIAEPVMFPVLARDIATTTVRYNIPDKHSAKLLLVCVGPEFEATSDQNLEDKKWTNKATYQSS